MTDIAKAIAATFSSLPLDISGDTRESLIITNRAGGQVPTAAQIDAAIAAYAPPAHPDWARFRTAMYSNAEYLTLIDSSGIAAKLDDLIWKREFDLAAQLWTSLKGGNKISSTLEAEIAQAATNANLTTELEIVTGS